MVSANKNSEADVVLIGAGIVSATLGALLHELEPGWSQILFERLDAPGLESSSPWNNAGTGHSALCELNYTPLVNGRINVAKAVGINEKFQLSRQFWAHQVDAGVLTDPREFINPVPHVSFGRGEQTSYIRKRYNELSGETLFPDMKFTDDPDRFAQMLPLMAQGRDFDSEPVAISWFNQGTDINYGAQTRQFIKNGSQENRFGHEVYNIRRDGDRWKVYAKNNHTGDRTVTRARFVFVGAGGKALPLLQKSGITEIMGYGGFPVSGQWLRCTNPDVVEQHAAKVYGKPSLGAPPMSVPHLDTRIIDGEKGLLFGPYAGWSPKFLKNGSYLDLFKTMKPNAIPAYLGVGVQETGLTKYLITELMKGFDAKMDMLRTYMPEARNDDWEIVVAGQRVQVIAPANPPRFGSLEFGTALINNGDGTIAGLLGASPGASIAPAASLEVVERCFGRYMVKWGPKIKELFPSYGLELNNDKQLFDEMWSYTQDKLQLDYEPAEAYR